MIISVASGKGGTGRTSIVGSLAALAKNKVLADCDVDAADLHRGIWSLNWLKRRDDAYLPVSVSGMRRGVRVSAAWFVS